MEYLVYILLFYVGFYFYRLAENHNKNKWLFGILGIVTYFIGTIIYPLFLRFFYSNEIDTFDVTIISLKTFLIGLLSTFFLFQLLSVIWSRKKKVNKKDIDKIGKQHNN